MAHRQDPDSAAQQEPLIWPGWRIGTAALYSVGVTCNLAPGAIAGLERRAACGVKARIRVKPASVRR